MSPDEANRHISLRSTTWIRGWRGFALVFVAQLLVYLLVFNSRLFADFGIANDYSVFLYDNKRCCLGFPETSHLFWIGRPLGGILLGAHLTFFDDIGSFAWGRLGSAVIGALTMGYVVHLLRRDPRSDDQVAILFGGLIFLLPACLVYVLWLTTLVPGTIAVALAAMAYGALRKPVQSSAAGRSRLRVAVGVSALVASMLIYLPSTVFYLVFTCWSAFFGEGSFAARLRRIVTDLLLVVGMSALYFLVARLAMPPVMKVLFGEGRRSRPQGGYRLEFAADIGRIARAVRDYVQAAAELWLVGWSGIFVLVGCAATIVLLVAAYRARSRDPDLAGRIVLTLGAALATIGLAAAPFALSIGGGFSVRNLFVPAAVVVLLIVVALRILLPPGGVRAAALVLLVIAGSAAAWRVDETVENASRELAAVRAALAAVKPDVSHVHVRLPPSGDRFAARPLFAEFGHLATNSGLNEGIVRAVLRERGIEPRNIRISVAPWGTPDVVGEEQQSFVVDLAEAGFRAATSQQAKRISWTVSVLPNKGCCSPAFAFDSEPGSFWESEAGFPITLALRFPAACFPVVAYRFVAPFTEFDRAPRTWRVRGIDAEGVAVDLDSQDGGAAWRSNEARRFAVSRPICAKSLQFEFLDGHDPKLLRIATIELERADGAMGEAGANPPRN